MHANTYIIRNLIKTAAIFRKFLVDSPYMWWSSNLVQVSLFRLHVYVTYHKLVIVVQLFLMLSLCRRQGNARCREATKGRVGEASILPHSLHRQLHILHCAKLPLPFNHCHSFICWISKDSITIQQIGSGARGLGIRSLGLDRSDVAAFLGSPLATPGFTIVNILVVYVVIVYIFIPVSYWTNIFEVKEVPYLLLKCVRG